MLGIIYFHTLVNTLNCNAGQCITLLKLNLHFTKLTDCNLNIHYSKLINNKILLENDLYLSPVYITYMMLHEALKCG